MAAPEERDHEIVELRRRLQEAEETLRAIGQGEVDALVVRGAAGERVYTLQGAEHPYRILVEQMQEGAATLTPDGDVLYCNRRFAELVGLGIERVIGGAIGRFIPADERAAVEALLRGGQGKHEGHVEAADGTRVPVYLSVSTFVLDETPTACLVVTDLTDLARTRRAQAAAEAAVLAKDEFMAMLAHELRNPLAAISSAVHVLDAQGEQEQPAVRAREAIARQVVILARLVDDLLDVTRMTTGKVVITPAAVDVGEIVRQCVTTLTDAGRLAGHRVSVHATSVGACADAARLEQIVLNLITNAVKFTPPGGRIEVAVTDEDGDAVVRVADEGIGMPADLLPRVFDLFVQGRRGLDRAGGGLGLGLTLVRRLVELHGGRVEAHSEGPGRGSVFTVRLPALAAAPAGPAAAPTASAAPTPSRRVLVAEDNDDSREMLQVWLQGLEHEVHVAADGVAAVDLALRVRPDIAFIDIGLPGLDGYEVARRIRAEERSEAMRLIALTGYGQPEDRRRALDAGFDDHVVKPMDLDALVRALNG